MLTEAQKKEYSQFLDKDGNNEMLDDFMEGYDSCNAGHPWSCPHDGWRCEVWNAGFKHALRKQAERFIANRIDWTPKAKRRKP